jgi:ABC-type sugar transport system ATPase subunit
VKDSGYEIELRDIHKKFGATYALRGIDLSIKRGEVHAIIGANGAGKSTLIKVISGAVRPNQGNIVVGGQQVRTPTPLVMQKMGIAVMYQELDLVPWLSVTENIFLGHEILRNGFIDFNKEYRTAEELLRELNQSISPKEIIAKLSIGKRQMVYLAKCLSYQTRVVIMDEPTSALSEHEIGELMKTIGRLKDRSISVIFVSHKLNEVLQIADRITILRDGMKINTHNEVNGISRDQIISEMIGKQFVDSGSAHRHSLNHLRTGRNLLSVKNLSGKLVADANFTLNAGEILGVTGLVGSGQEELAALLGGAAKPIAGRIELNGKELNTGDISFFVKAGIYMVPEDRRTQGLIFTLSISENILISNLFNYTIGPFIDWHRTASDVRNVIRKINVKAPNIDASIATLSGGNQQKVVIAKWLLREGKILIFNEPTRGVDISSKREIYFAIEEFVRHDRAVIIISTDIEEIMTMCHSVMVCYNGQLHGPFAGGPQNKELVMETMLGKGVE